MTESPTERDEILRRYALVLAAEFERLTPDGRARSMIAVLESARDATPDSVLRDSLVQVHQGILSGHAMSTMLAEQPQIYSEPFRTVVRFGEIFGELDLVLRRWGNGEDRRPP